MVRSSAVRRALGRTRSGGRGRTGRVTGRTETSVCFIAITVATRDARGKKSDFRSDAGPSSVRGMSFVAQDPIEPAFEDPFFAFDVWYAEAQQEPVKEPTAVALATADTRGMPSCRMVLLKDHGPHGFVFYTNYDSRKGRELTDNPRAALLFHWYGLERQVRIAGRVERVPTETSDAYFASRPRGSQLGAHASEQSSVIASRSVLAQRMGELEDRFRDQTVPRPAHWGGLQLVPESFEFWQGQTNRLHDRLRYTAGEGGAWRIDRLAP